jgi:DNA-binding transcriptional ArsR family regulator
MLAYIFASKLLRILISMEIRRDVFQAIADPTRREIIHLIAHHPQNLNSIAENFDMSRQAISLHVKILHECGLLSIKQQGRERICEAKLKQLSQVSNWLEHYRKLWDVRFDAMDDLLIEMNTKKKINAKKNKK